MGHLPELFALDVLEVYVNYRPPVLFAEQ